MKKTKTIQATELRKGLYRELKKVARSRHEITVSHHGKPIARISPCDERPGRPTLTTSTAIDLCSRYDLRAIYLFGSVLTEDFDESKSDVDVLVDYVKVPSMFKLGRLTSELEGIFGRQVDLVTMNGLTRYCTYEPMRRSILENMRLVYGEPRDVLREADACDASAVLREVLDQAGMGNTNQ